MSARKRNNKGQFEKTVTDGNTQTTSGYAHVNIVPQAADYDWLRIPLGELEMRKPGVAWKPGSAWKSVFDEMVDMGYKVDQVSLTNAYVFVLFKR